MSRLYYILSVAGWAWLFVVAVFLVVRLLIAPKRREPRGFDVIEPAQPGRPELDAAKLNGRT
jgi:hypothetical protein